MRDNLISLLLVTAALFLFTSCRSSPPPLKLPEVNLDEKKIHEKDCRRGVARSCFEVGKMEEQSGKLASARSYFKEACEKGEKEACVIMRAKKGKN